VGGAVEGHVSVGTEKAQHGNSELLVSNYPYFVLSSSVTMHMDK